MSQLNKVCFTICMVTIILGMLLGLGIIWGGVDSEVAWKAANTLAMFFLGAAAASGVNTFFNKK